MAIQGRNNHAYKSGVDGLVAGRGGGGPGPGGGGAQSGAPPPAAIPTFSTDDLSRTGIFYAGGKYVGSPGKETMGGDAYVEVWVPKQIRHPYPLAYIHGAGQTATDWLQTPDG